MKLVQYSIFFLSVLLVACEEQMPTGLNLTDSGAKDTTYVSAQVETPQTKKVLIEELTGASCTNCPTGTTMLKGFVTQHPNRIVVTALHTGFLTDKPFGALYYFPNDDADQLRLYFNEGDPGKPSAAFDRTKGVGGNSDGKYFLNHGGTGADWISTLNTRLAKTTPVNLHITSTLNALTQKIDVKTTIAFTEAFNEPLSLSLYVIEDSITDVQLDKTLGAIPNYSFNHVFRKLVTPVGGEGVLDSIPNKTAGRVLVRNISFDPNLTGSQTWNIDHCHLVGILHKTGNSKEVLQVEEVKLK